MAGTGGKEPSNLQQNGNLRDLAAHTNTITQFTQRGAFDSLEARDDDFKRSRAAATAGVAKTWFRRIYQVKVRGSLNHSIPQLHSHRA